MSDPTTTRQARTGGRVRTAFEGAIKRPVKEAVREALAEGVRGQSGESDAEGAPVRVAVPDGSDGSEDVSADDEPTGSSGASRSLLRRLLGSRRALMFVSVLLATYLRRRRRSDADTA